MTSFIDSFLIWWLRSVRYRWSRLRRRMCEHKYLSLPLPAANSLEEIENCLGQVKWTMDGPLHLFDAISYPQATWAKKRDDCDGFAILAAELIRRWQPGYHPILLTAMFRPMRASHTVCALRIPSGSLRVFDNGKLHKSEYADFLEVVVAIQRQARLVCWDAVDPQTLETIEFHKA